MRRGEYVLQQSWLPSQPLLSRPGLHVSRSVKADLRGEKALWPAYAGGQDLLHFCSHPELPRPLPRAAGLRQAAGWGLCVPVFQNLGVTKMGPQGPRRGWHLLEARGLAQEGQRAPRPQRGHRHRPECPTEMNPNGIPETRSGSVLEDHLKMHERSFLAEGRGTVGRWARGTAAESVKFHLVKGTLGGGSCKTDRWYQ